MVWGIHFPEPLPKAPRRARASFVEKAQRSGFFDSLNKSAPQGKIPFVEKAQRSGFFDSLIHLAILRRVLYH